MWDIAWVWAEAFLRWLHVIAGIGWIGSSFYFIHLDYSLKQREGLPAQAYGEAWQVHGGGFYNMVKYLVAPARMPEELTWFKWEAYATWISGFALVVAIYYAGASLYLIDPAVLAISPATGIAISVAGLVLGWAVYDGALPLAARPQRDRAGGGRLRLSRRAGLRLDARLQRARRLHADGRADRHHHGRQRADGDHPRPAQGGGRPDRRAHARSRPRPARQAALDPQQLSHPAGRVRDDLRPLSAGLRDALELGDPGAAARHGRGDAPFLQHAPPGPAEPVVDLGCRRRRAGCDRVALDAGPGAERRARASAPTRRRRAREIPAGGGHRHQPLQHVPRRRAGLGRHLRAPKGVLLDTPARIKAHAREIAVASVWSSAMPPSNITDLTAEERQTLAAWLASDQK